MSKIFSSSECDSRFANKASLALTKKLRNLNAFIRRAQNNQRVADCDAYLANQNK